METEGIDRSLDVNNEIQPQNRTGPTHVHVFTHLVVCCRSFVVIAFGVGNLMGIDRLGAVAAGPKQVLFFSFLAKEMYRLSLLFRVDFFFCGFFPLHWESVMPIITLAIVNDDSLYS